MSDFLTSTQLYSELISLTEEGESFYFQDYGNYRVFNYRLASYTEFMKPSALEARGITFYMKEGEAPKLVCRPFKKFFNLNENPMTMDLDMSKVYKWAIKEDGSIISSFIDQERGEIRLKSKQSLVSEQATMAMNWLNANQRMKQEVTIMTESGFTIMFELVGPTNRIVLEYPKTELRVIGARHMASGTHASKEAFQAYPAIYEAWTQEFTGEQVQIEDVPAMIGLEGYVATMEDGLMFKVKTDWYKTLHHLKDSVETPRRLFDAIIDECVDDVKAMFSTDTFTLNRISEMESKVIPIYNHLIATVENFYSDNKHLERKDYAIKGQSELKNLFSLAMGKYTGKGLSYKDFSKKYREEIFGISASDEPIKQE